MRNITKIALFSALVSNAALANFFVGGSVSQNQNHLRTTETGVVNDNLESRSHQTGTDGSVGINLEAGYKYLSMGKWDFTADAFLDLNTFNSRTGNQSALENIDTSAKYSIPMYLGLKVRAIYSLDSAQMYGILGLGVMNLKQTFTDGPDIDEKKSFMLPAIKLGVGILKEVSKDVYFFTEFNYDFAIKSADLDYTTPNEDGKLTLTTTPTVFGMRIGSRFYF